MDYPLPFEVLDQALENLLRNTHPVSGELPLRMNINLFPGVDETVRYMLSLIDDRTGLFYESLKLKESLGFFTAKSVESCLLLSVDVDQDPQNPMIMFATPAWSGMIPAHLFLNDEQELGRTIERLSRLMGPKESRGIDPAGDVEIRFENELIFRGSRDDVITLSASDSAVCNELKKMFLESGNPIELAVRRRNLICDIVYRAQELNIDIENRDLQVSLVSPSFTSDTREIAVLKLPSEVFLISTVPYANLLRTPPCSDGEVYPSSMHIGHALDSGISISPYLLLADSVIIHEIMNHQLNNPLYQGQEDPSEKGFAPDCGY